MSPRNRDGHSPRWWKRHPEARYERSASQQENTFQQKSIGRTLWSWPVIGTLVILAIGTGGVGVLSMTPPETTVAVCAFSIGFALLLVRLFAWIALETSDPTSHKTAFVIGALILTGLACYLCIAFALSKAPHNGPQVLSFDSLVAIENMPETRAVKNTWDGKPWNHDLYADVRLTMENKSDYRLENIDLSIATPGEDNDPFRVVMAAIDQTTNLPGIEFPPPPGLDTNIRLRGQGGIVNIPINPLAGLTGGWKSLPVPSVKLYASKIMERQRLELILATYFGGTGKKLAPKQLRISGTYDVVLKSGNKQSTTLNSIVDVK